MGATLWLFIKRYQLRHRQTHFDLNCVNVISFRLTTTSKNLYDFKTCSLIPLQVGSGRCSSPGTGPLSPAEGPRWPHVHHPHPLHHALLSSSVKRGKELWVSAINNNLFYSLEGNLSKSLPKWQMAVNGSCRVFDERDFVGAGFLMAR